MKQERNIITFSLILTCIFLSFSIVIEYRIYPHIDILSMRSLNILSGHRTFFQDIILSLFVSSIFTALLSFNSYKSRKESLFLSQSKFYVNCCYLINNIASNKTSYEDKIRFKGEILKYYEDALLPHNDITQGYNSNEKKNFEMTYKLVENVVTNLNVNSILNSAFLNVESYQKQIEELKFKLNYIISKKTQIELKKLILLRN